MGDGVGGLDIQRHEFDAVIHAVGGEQAPGQGVVERLVQLTIDTAIDQGGEIAFDLRPEQPGIARAGQQLLQPCTALAHAEVIQFNTRDCVGFGGGPITVLEALAGTPADLGEAMVVILEALRDATGKAGGQCAV